MALALSGTSNGSLNNLSLSGNTATIVDTARAGGIVQVVTATTATSVAVSTTTYTDTGLSASITPSSSSNKILVMVNQMGNAGRSARPMGFGMQLLRDSTAISVKTVGVGTGAANGQGCRDTFAICHLDEPSTTSQITYKTQGKVNTTSNSGTCRFQEGSTRSEIVLIEIAG